MSPGAIPFNRAYRTGDEGQRINAALASGWTGGNGPFTAACERLLEAETGARRVLLTHSCTGALEMAALLSGVGRGDEVVLPSYTFVSTANARVLRGATPAGAGIQAYFHHVPLHSSPARRRYGRVAASIAITDRVGETLVRMPLWVGLAEDEVDRVVEEVGRALTGHTHAVR